MSKTNWKSVVVFYFFACLWSWPFFWWRDLHSDSWKAFEIPNFLKSWSIMWGPGLAALLCFLIFRSTHKRITTFQGTSFKHGLIFYLILPLSITLVHQDPKFLKIGIFGFISILGEELGWRGFLQDALKLKSDFSKAILIGVMWEAWHFTTRILHPGVTIRLLIWMSVTIAFSFLMIKLTKKTNSLFIPVTMHMALNAAFEFDRGWQSVLVCVPFWILIFWNWIKQPILNTVNGESVI